MLMLCVLMRPKKFTTGSSPARSVLTGEKIYPRALMPFFCRTLPTTMVIVPKGILATRIRKAERIKPVMT